MAKNWLMFEAVDVFLEGKDKSAIQELGSRYPITSRLLAISLSHENRNEVAELLNSFPNYITIRKIEAALKEGVEKYAAEIPEEQEKEVDEEIKETKKKKKAPKKVEEDEDDDEEEAVEEEKPKKKKKAEKKEKPKKKKVVEEDEEEDDDDDFDFDFDD